LAVVLIGRQLAGVGHRRPGAARAEVVRGVGVGGLGIAAVLATHLWDFRAHDLRIRILDAGSAWSFSHLLATCAFATGAVAGAVGVRARVAPRRWWWACAALFSFFLLDNVTRLHEHIPGWPVFYVPLLAALSAALLSLVAGTDLEAVVVAGLGLLVVSLAIHVLGPAAVRAAGWSEHGMAYQVKIGLKEGFELGGWLMVTPAIARRAWSARGEHP
jgi:hypothetical protein